MYRFLSPTIVFLAFIHLSACSTAPDFERKNTKDPKSEYYVPEVPENSPISLALDSNRHVILKWDSKEYQNGVIIAKKNRSNTPFVTLDTLYNNTLSYVDESGIFIPGTTYKVDFFRILDDSSIVLNKESALISLKFEPFESINISYNENLKVDTEYGHNPEEGAFRYFDGLEVQINSANRNAPPEWQTVGTIDIDENANGFFNTDFSFDLFDLDIRINQFIADSSGNRIVLKSESNRLYINSISGVSASFVDEINLQVNWNSKSSFADGYIINSYRTDTLFGANKRSFILPLINIPQQIIYVSVQPFKGNNFGKVTEAPHRIYRNVYSPEFTGLTHLGLNSLEITWNIQDNSYIAGYIIEQSTLPENNYVTIDTVSKDQTSYVVSNLDPDKTFNFVVHSYTSEWSRYITAAYQNTFISKQANELDVIGFETTYSKNGKYIAKIVPESLSDNYPYIVLKNLETSEEFTLELPRAFDDWRARFDDMVISEKNNTLIFLWDRDQVGSPNNYISVYDIPNKKYTIENKPNPATPKAKNLELMSDDNHVVIHSREEFTIFNSLKDSLVRKISLHHSSYTITRPYKDTALNCFDNGISEYDLTTGQIINHSNEPCQRGSINESSDLLVFFSTNSVKVLDLQTFAIIDEIADERLNVVEDSYLDLWYFKEGNLLIYQQFNGYYHGYNSKKNQSFVFKLPIFKEDQWKKILSINRNTDGTYSVISLDGKFIFSYEESWSLLEIGPERS